MARITDIADAIVTQLNGLTLSQWFEAERAYIRPVIDREDLTRLRVIVVPMDSAAVVGLTRNAAQEDHRVDVAVFAPLRQADNAEVDPWVDFAEELVDALRRLRLTSPDAICIQAIHQPIADWDYLTGKAVFASVISTTWRKIA